MNTRALNGTLLLAIAGSAFGLIGCSGQSGDSSEGETVDLGPAITASATLAATRGNVVRGTVTFTQTPEGVIVFAQLSGLTPGEHGFHVHENGDCSSGDGASAGGHFNPMNMEHAGPDAEARHVGDLGNIVVDEGGMGVFERLDPLLSLTDPLTSIVGRSVIVHASADDMSSQPSGAAGPRLACGVILLNQ